MNELEFNLLKIQLLATGTELQKGYANLYKYLFDKAGIANTDLAERIKDGKLV